MNKPLRPGDVLASHDAHAPAAIRFEGVTKAFTARERGAVQALSGIDLSVPAGSILGVIGRSGAGKSTLVRLVNGLDRPSSGRVLVHGAEVSGLSGAALRDVRRRVGMVFQHFNLLSSRTAFDNVALPLELAGLGRAAIRRKVEPLLALVGLSDKRDRYSAELSGGQKQRVGIARALATDPSVLLSDEATSALDPETTRQILDLLATVNRELGLTVLLITHEMSVIRGVARQVAVLDRGRVVEHGDVFDIFTRPAHPVTQSLLEGEPGRALPPVVRDRLRPDPVPGGATVIRILFRGPYATDPILTQLARELALDVNILAGSVDEIAGRPFGTLVVGLPVDAAGLARAMRFLIDRGLDAEVLGHVA